MIDKFPVTRTFSLNLSFLSQDLSITCQTTLCFYLCLFHPPKKWKFCHNLLSLMLFQTCTFFWVNLDYEESNILQWTGYVSQQIMHVMQCKTL